MFFVAPLRNWTNRSLTTRTYHVLTYSFLRILHSRARTQHPVLWKALRHRMDLGLITHDEDASRRSTETDATARAFVA